MSKARHLKTNPRAISLRSPGFWVLALFLALLGVAWGGSTWHASRVLEGALTAELRLERRAQVTVEKARLAVEQVQESFRATPRTRARMTEIRVMGEDVEALLGALARAEEDLSTKEFQGAAAHAETALEEARQVEQRILLAQRYSAG